MEVAVKKAKLACVTSVIVLAITFVGGPAYAEDSAQDELYDSTQDVLYVEGILPNAVVESGTSDESEIITEEVTDAAGSVRFTKYKVIDIHKVRNWTNKSKQLGICKIQAGAGGGTCSISNSYTVSASVQTAFGATVGHLTGSLGINASQTVSGTVTWTSGKAPAGTTYKAWAVGNRATYKVEKWTGFRTAGMKETTWKLESTSGTLSAFEPVVGFAVGQ
ncbi:hypothetical protein [Microbacterium resistens]|uniref:hypothetical protein n=1 Tax=Microbacterium resistens TaxID=156977 RepID=UPI00366A6B4E